MSYIHNVFPAQSTIKLRIPTRPQKKRCKGKSHTHIEILILPPMNALQQARKWNIKNHRFNRVLRMVCKPTQSICQCRSRRWQCFPTIALKQSRKYIYIQSSIKNTSKSDVTQRDSTQLCNLKLSWLASSIISKNCSNEIWQKFSKLCGFKAWQDKILARPTHIISLPSSHFAQRSTPTHLNGTTVQTNNSKTNKPNNWRWRHWRTASRAAQPDYPAHCPLPSGPAWRTAGTRWPAGCCTHCDRSAGVWKTCNVVIQNSNFYSTTFTRLGLLQEVWFETHT